MSYSIKTKNIFNSEIKNLKEIGCYKDESIMTTPQGCKVDLIINGSAKTLINLCSNDYLGLSSHPEIFKIISSRVHEKGYGLSSVRFICGTQDSHKILESNMSDFLGTEDTLLVSSCYDANSGFFEAVFSEEDIIISDRLIHASLIDGIRLSKAQHDTYKHSDIDHLERKLIEHSEKRIKVIVTDGVFSMDGDIAKLDHIIDLGKKHDAIVFVDDSHATGVIGSNGKGTHEYYNLINEIDVITTTFGKALGGASGGCISGKKEIIDLCRQKVRPYLFSNSLAPVIVLGCLKALEILKGGTDLIDNIRANATYWRTGLQELGFIVNAGITPIIPIMLYNEKLVQCVSNELLKEGVFAIGFSYPVVPRGQARIRTQVSSGHNELQLNEALRVFSKVGKKFNILGKTKDQLINLI